MKLYSCITLKFTFFESYVRVVVRIRVRVRVRFRLRMWVLVWVGVRVRVRVRDRVSEFVWQNRLKSNHIYKTTQTLLCCSTETPNFP